MKLVRLEAARANMRLEEAHNAYSNGQEPRAVELFREAAELAGQNGNAAAEQHARRWQGNSLMWSGRYEEAFQVLTMAASYDQPDADPASVYGAKTDRILLSLSIASAAVCRDLLHDARAYLDRIGNPEWSHRVEMLEGILLFRQGEYLRSAEFTIRAIRLVGRWIGGPAYSRASHVKWVTRPLFYGHQKVKLAEWVAQSSTPEAALTERCRQGCVRLLALRMETAAGTDVKNTLRDEARTVAALASEMRGIWDEVFEISRALMLAGDWEAMERLPIERMNAVPFESALFAADREINWLRRKLELPPWDGDLDWPQAAPVAAKDLSAIEPGVQKIRGAFAKLREEASREDQRMETTIYTAATARRLKHVATLLPGIGCEQS